MKKILILLLLVAVAAGAYKLLGSSTDFEQLEYVPADTPVLSAQLKPVDMEAYLSSLGLFPGQMDQILVALEAETGGDDTPTSAFLLTLLKTYISALSKPEELTQTTGLKNELRSMLYMVGITPVLQVELASAENFVAYFKNAQESSGIEYSLESVDGNEYHRFSIVPEEEFELLVRTNNNWGVITMHTPKLDKAHLLASLAITKPENNIVNSGVLKTMQNDYKLRPDGIGFISTKQIGLAFSQKDGNSLASDLELLIGEQFAEDLVEVRSAQCKADIDMLTGMWPGMFMDSAIDTSGEGVTISSRTVIPTTSKTAIDGLKAMRGFLPAYATNGASSSFFSMGVGFDVANLSRSVSSMWSGLVNLDVSCGPLVELKQEMTQNNPTGAFAMAGVANGLMGMAAAINAIDVSGMQEGNLSVDAVVSVSAEDVKALYGTIQTFAPMLGAITLPNEGEELLVNEVFPMLDQFGVNVTAMATQSQLVLFTGEESRKQATQTLTEAPVKNGLMSFGMDYKKFFEQLKPMMEMSGEPVPPEMEAMLDTDMAASFTTDVSDIGIEVTLDMVVKK